MCAYFRLVCISFSWLRTVSTNVKWTREKSFIFLSFPLVFVPSFCGLTAWRYWRTSNEFCKWNTHCDLNILCALVHMYGLVAVLFVCVWTLWWSDNFGALLCLVFFTQAPVVPSAFCFQVRHSSMHKHWHEHKHRELSSLLLVKNPFLPRVVCREGLEAMRDHNA